MSLELFSTMRVVALPTKTNFRGINVREVALFKGEFGWGEFSPFLEYGYEESALIFASSSAATSAAVL
jgi:O-succinylbenzoate synthase